LHATWQEPSTADDSWKSECSRDIDTTNDPESDIAGKISRAPFHTKKQDYEEQPFLETVRGIWRPDIHAKKELVK
jgi:hypothetical protein